MYPLPTCRQHVYTVQHSYFFAFIKPFGYIIHSFHYPFISWTVGGPREGYLPEISPFPAGPRRQEARGSHEQLTGQYWHIDNNGRPLADTQIGNCINNELCGQTRYEALHSEMLLKMSPFVHAKATEKISSEKGNFCLQIFLSVFQCFVYQMSCRRWRETNDQLYENQRICSLI